MNSMKNDTRANHLEADDVHLTKMRMKLLENLVMRQACGDCFVIIFFFWFHGLC